MPLVVNHSAVIDLLDEARSNGWVIPAFGVENLTTMEAVLAAASLQGQEIARADLPIALAVTNQYPSRRQTSYYTHTRRWDMGLRLFLAEAAALMAPGSPYANLRVMLHLDHALYDLDAELFKWDFQQFSSIMFDASALPLEQNISLTRQFVEQRGHEIVIEGACDSIGHCDEPVTDPAVVERYWRETGIDLVVANLGTEHRASASTLCYEKKLAQAMAARIGSRLVLHGTSSVAAESLGSLAHDGICKANLWTALERDSSGVLLEEMARHAAKIAGGAQARALHHAGVLGDKVDLASNPDIDYFTTAWRQQIVFEKMKRIASIYLRAWFPQ